MWWWEYHIKNIMAFLSHPSSMVLNVAGFLWSLKHYSIQQNSMTSRDEGGSNSPYDNLTNHTNLPLPPSSISNYEWLQPTVRMFLLILTIVLIIACSLGGETQSLGSWKSPEFWVYTWSMYIWAQYSQTPM